jgi:hypothetical protein
VNKKTTIVYGRHEEIPNLFPPITESLVEYDDKIIVEKNYGNYNKESISKLVETAYVATRNIFVFSFCHCTLRVYDTNHESKNTIYGYE